MSSALSLLEKRRDRQSKPKNRDDGRFVAIVIEGGAMRGVVSGGMVSALEELGLSDSVDAVYGSSAGAIAGAYFIGKQARYGTTIYYEDINNRKFIDLTRPLSGRNAVSLEFLLDDVCVNAKPLDVAAILNSDIELNIVAASLESQKAIAISDFTSGDEIRTALKGSARIPFFAGPPVEWKGDRLLDASLYESIPYKLALADPRVTDIVVLLTRPSGNTRSAPNAVDKMLVIPYLRRMSPTLAEQYARRDADYKEEMADLAQLSMSDAGGRSVTVIQLEANDPKISSLEKSRERLVAGALAGFKAVYRAFSYDADAFLETIGSYRARRLE